MFRYVSTLAHRVLYELTNACILADISMTEANESIPAPPESRPFTIKAVVFGLLAAVAIVVAGALNNVMREWQTPLIGHYLPAAPFALLMVLAVVWNPTLGRWARLRFSPGEMAVVFGLTLVCAWIPHGGFGRFFQRAVALPPTQIDAHPEWRRSDAMGHLPPNIMPMDGSPVAGPLRAAIANERSALVAGANASALAAAGTDATAYAVALDLASVIPPREFLADQSLARIGADLAVQRHQSQDPARWQAVADLLAQMPKTLASGEQAPPAWRLAQSRLKTAVQETLPESERLYERVYPGFLNGLPNGDEVVGFKDLPVAAWIPTLAFWLPLIISGAVASLMLALVVHRQWSSHEQLRYPIANVATTLMTRSGSSLIADVFCTRLFWWGFIPVVCLHGLNFLALQLPGLLPNIPLQWSNKGVVEWFLPNIGQSGGNALNSGGLYFSVIGLSYFIAAEISLSVGISGMVLAVLATLFWWASNGSATMDVVGARSGAYFGFAAIIVYTGRHYYWAVLQAAFGRQREDVAAEQAWAARLFLAAGVAFIAVLVGGFGLDWPVALCFSLAVLVLMLVVSRIVCETGMPFVQAGWGPAQVVANMLGFAAIGPAPLMTMYLIGGALFKEARESLLPFASTALKVAENTGVPRLRFALIGTVAMLIALVAGIAATSWGLYNFGASHDNFAFWPGADALDAGTRGVNQLVETGRYVSSAAAHGLDKLPLISWNPTQSATLGWMAFGVAVVLAFSAGRFRWTWFPFHPVMFVMMGTWVSMRIWCSILLGWAIKAVIVRYGGGRIYQDLKPLFIGLIIGELAMAIVCVVHPWLWFAITGVMPPSMAMFPS